MNQRKFFADMQAAIKDPEMKLEDRVFLVYTVISEITVLAALIGDLFLGENIYEITTLLGVLFFVPGLTYLGLYYKMLNIVRRIIVTGIVFVILPIIFFFGGGLEGGGVLWIIFGFMYAGHVLSGRWRKSMLTMIVILTSVFFVIQYYYPEYIIHHSRRVYFVDFFLSLILVGVVCFSMTWFQNVLYQDESQRAKMEAQKAEELTRAQNRFFSSMSHEIRTPINSILGLNELILRDATDPDEIAKNAAGIQGAGRMLLALINDILDFSKMEAGSMEIVPVDYNVGDMLSEIVNMIWLKASEKGLKFEVSIDPQVPSVLYGDEVRIQQVIINLLNNAVKYTAEGFVELHVESEPVDEDTVSLRIAVSDSGMGIKKETLPFLFDAFKRVDEEKNRHIEGTGLGLNIAKQIVELMGGSISVNSVYGSGSVFMVVLKQGISNPDVIGELNIHNQQNFRRKAYESSFTAPTARILIVDDNEMNLEVERKLILTTEMIIDTSVSGRDALERTLSHHYDVILMDHLMPEMDGIECLEKIRNQEGGLNVTTPVVVLTANAGSDNRDMYNRAGFDGYLIKPVSGEMLEQILMKYISREKLILSARAMSMKEDINTLEGYAGKAPVIITATSMCDLPDRVIKKLRLPIIPFLIHTDETVFKDGVQMGTDELIRYVSEGKKAISSPPSEKAYTDFFSENLKKAHHLIHIAMTTSMSEDYEIATEAASAFDNVTVINSGCLSSATGLLVLIAYKLAQQNIPVDEIVEELEAVKTQLKCSFVIDTTDYMMQKGLISSAVDRLAKALNLHPFVRIRNDKAGIAGAWIGDRKRTYKMYIRSALPVGIAYDPEVVFITYAEVPIDTLLWIKEEVTRIAKFKEVIFVQASAAITSNCGPGAFGILYFVKGGKSYNIASLVEDEYKIRGDESEENEVDPETDDYQDLLSLTSAEPAWYEGLSGIDPQVALKNCGSEESLKSVMKIFYESIPEKTRDIEKYYEEGDWADYTIKVHALKSSAKLIGALGFANEAQLLENAGKEGDEAYIRQNHGAFMSAYGDFESVLSPVFGEPEEKGEKDERPVADAYMLKSVYEELKSAADAMDSDRIEDILKEMSEYAISEEASPKFERIRTLADSYDYEGMLKLLDQS